MTNEQTYNEIDRILKDIRFTYSDNFYHKAKKEADMIKQEGISDIREIRKRIYSVESLIKFDNFIDMLTILKKFKVSEAIIN